MKCYPIKEIFVPLFYDRQEVLLYLIQHHSPQLPLIFETVDCEDFLEHCLSFYGDENYECQDTTLIYTHPITQQKSYCYVRPYGFTLSSLLGFEQFLKRYFYYYFVVEEENSRTSWLTYRISV